MRRKVSKSRAQSVSARDKCCKAGSFSNASTSALNPSYSSSVSMRQYQHASDVSAVQHPSVSDKRSAASGNTM
eukprot:123873-Rhodomonas_salina.2